MRFYKLIASGLGTGYAPIAPGTVGSLLGGILFYAMNWVLNDNDLIRLTTLATNLFAIAFITFLGVYAIRKVHQVWKHDASEIVIDEIAGVGIAAFALPFHWKYYLAAFVLFRFFDIVKPFFIKQLDLKKTHWSVMLDDLLAGLYANVFLQLFIYLKLF